MEFFRRFFKDRKTGQLSESTNEWAVCCPFPHTRSDSSEYYEDNPSSHINTLKSIFHCKSCNVGLSEVEFIQKVNNGATYGESLQILEKLNKKQNVSYKTFLDMLSNSPGTQNTIQQLGLETVKNELQLGYDGKGITFPVFMYGEIQDIRTYTPNPEEGQPKVKGRPGSTQSIFPFDRWVTTKDNENAPTLLCAGEKDTAIAIANGFNAICFTGGERSFPKLFRFSFTNRKDRRVYIIYDNDDAGREGAVETAAKLKELGAEPYVIDGHYQTCKEKGEDLHDFFLKYKKSKEDLTAILAESPTFSGEIFEKARNKIHPFLMLKEAKDGKYQNREVSSRISTIATFSETYHAPEVVDITIYDSETEIEKNIQWVLDDDRLASLLELIEVNNKMQYGFFANQMNLTKKQKMSYKVRSRIPVHKAVITDDMETEVILKPDYKVHELTVYSLHEPLYDGEKYRIFYKPVTHPKDQSVVGIVTKVEANDSSVNQFVMTDEIKEQLKCFQGAPVTKMEELYERAKAIIGMKLNQEIFFPTELTYHTPLYFPFGPDKHKACLDGLIVGESQVGKSYTFEKLQQKYGLGTIVSVKHTTETALAGGSHKENGGMKTRLGVIPRNHRGIICLEELSGAPRDVINKLTDIRSSGVVRIERVVGTKTAPAVLRMLALSNPRTNTNGESIPLRAYPNGIELVLDLIGASEDIGRYDFIRLIDFSDSKATIIDKPTVEAYPDEAYKNRIRWVWSRKEDQVEIEEDVQRYIIDQADALNERYGCHINFFGMVAWRKLARLAIAVAGCVCSMDETGEKLVVKKTHVAWAIDFMKKCYDNDLFRLRQYVEEERQYTNLDHDTVKTVQILYQKHTTILKALDNNSSLERNQLADLSGLEKDEFRPVIKRLAECYLIKYRKNSIIPTERFRKAMNQVTRNFNGNGVG